MVWVEGLVQLAGDNVLIVVAMGVGIAGFWLPVVVVHRRERRRGE